MPEPQISTLADLPFHVVGRYPRPTLVQRCTPDGFDTYSSNDLFDRIRTLSLGLAALGVKPGDRVALMSDSRPEWVIADLAILTAGAVTVPIYPTLPAALAGYILADSGAEVAIVADEVQAAKVRQARPELAQLRELILIDGDSGADRDGETTLAAVQARGHQRLMTENGLARRYKEAAAAIDAEELATIIYTSGTTGDAKGVMLTHAAIVANLIDVDASVHFEETDEALSFLPLSHAFERTTVYMYLFKGVTVTFAESLDTVARDMVQVRPTVMTGVPRVFEKLHSHACTTWWRSRRPSGSACSTGPSAWGARGSWPAAAAAGRRCSPALPTGSCSRRSGSAPAAGCGSSARAARRCRSTSPTSCSRSGYRCWRGTA